MIINKLSIKSVENIIRSVIKLLFIINNKWLSPNIYMSSKHIIFRKSGRT
jgi:hypothetical protein